MANPFKSWNASTARAIYRAASTQAGGNRELFAQILARDLTRAGFPLPGWLARATAATRAAGPSVAKTAAVGAAAAASAPLMVPGLVVAAGLATAIAVLVWRRRRKASNSS